MNWLLLLSSKWGDDIVTHLGGVGSLQSGKWFPVVLCSIWWAIGVAVQSGFISSFEIQLTLSLDCIGSWYSHLGHMWQLFLFVFVQMHVRGKWRPSKAPLCPKMNEMPCQLLLCLFFLFSQGLRKKVQVLNLSPSQSNPRVAQCSDTGILKLTASFTCYTDNLGTVVWLSWLAYGSAC